MFGEWETRQARDLPACQIFYMHVNDRFSNAHMLTLVYVWVCAKRNLGELIENWLRLSVLLYQQNIYQT